MVADSEFCIRYFPTSLAGVLELAVNANGDVITPMSMAHGRIPAEYVLGNVLYEDAVAIWERIAGPQGQQVYGSQLLLERERLLHNAPFVGAGTGG